MFHQNISPLVKVGGFSYVYLSCTIVVHQLNCFCLEIELPAFNRDLSSIDDLVVGQSVSGVVSNVTPFGVFIDFGVEKNGLIHESKLGSARNLGPGDRCHCSIISIDKSRMRIGLKFKCLTSAIPVLQ